uniref:DUF4276 domain-containing protein n=1 Tax=Candidatus Kentrum sp. DK TaxID=2126562 RepID=A0A450T8P0_9GAMM|nr:MAG: hypothetical protein BECKDK2373C_GA0170839_11035 [Candidatus Kentron sp. DK]
MHFEILVEDQSGKKALDILVPRMIGNGHTFKVLPYKGIGRIPKHLTAKSDPRKRILLDRLPQILRGYGNTFANYPADYPAAVIVVCDLDDRRRKAFRQELLTVLNTCDPRPKTRFCIAIEEGEAWFLGDIPAIKAAYPEASDAVLDGYVNDSICGTWEKLADAVFKGGAAALKKKGWQAIGAEKSRWSEEITPHMDVSNNLSPSFVYFRDKLRGLAGANG